MPFVKGALNPGNGRPVGSQNRRSKALFDRLEARGDLDPADFLSSIVTDPNQSPEYRIQSANNLLPFKYPRVSSVAPPRYIEDAPPLPPLDSLKNAVDSIALIEQAMASGSFDVQSGQDLISACKEYIAGLNIMEVEAMKERLEVLEANASNSNQNQIPHVQGGMPALPGTRISMPGQPPATNGHAIESHPFDARPVDEPPPRPINTTPGEPW
jgi:hypothetical protein